MSDWKTSVTSCEYDVLLYGFLLHPCLFGENSAHIVKHPSCVSHTLSYTGLGLTGNCLGTLLGTALFSVNGPAGPVCGSIFSSLFIGTYAGEMRTRLRKKYDIPGDLEQDIMIHTLCSPCAVCQEAQEIRLRENERRADESESCEWAPVPQEMKQP